MLAQRTGEQGRDLAPAPPAPGVCTAAPETPTTAASLAAAVEHGTEPRPSPPSGRERLSLHATLLI
ncbi:MAG TPA: hypothetical protein VMV46_08805 [Thermoanaerobaculia bacterium]|nr:hypothetical protein [Thermoanaerobaculia bacterium]